ncbi:MAG: riboflavin biosynthesis protein RibF [bacterium]|nr:riboflavin biosynthesis protein RibF [bacterium]
MKKTKTQIIWDISDLSNYKIPKKSVMCIGNFDGIHQGHRAVIYEGKRISDKSKKPLCILSFLPHPRLLLNSKNFFILTDIIQKIGILGNMNTEYIILLNFAKIMNMEADEFCGFLDKNFDPDYICTGFDFSFGKGAKGNAEYIKKYFERLGKGVKIVEKVSTEAGDEKISSSYLRKLIFSGNVSEYISLVGRPYLIRGTVVKGSGRGKKIGVPTANITTTYKLPPHGVYASLVKIQGEPKYIYSVSNIGYQPTFNSFRETLETHILDFSQEIYGKKIEVMFVKYLREIKKFNSPDELVNQIKEDIRKSRLVLDEISEIITQY